MLTTAVNGISALRFVAGIPGRLSSSGKSASTDTERLLGQDLQPVNFAIMCKLIDKLVNNAVDANRSTDQLELGIGRVVENEVVAVKVRQLGTANAASQLCSKVSLATTTSRALQ